MRLKIRTGLARKAGANSFEMSVAGPNRPAFEFCDVFSVGSRSSPQFPGQSPRRPCPSDPPDLYSADRVWPPQAGWLPPSAPARRCRLQIVHLAPANFTNIAGSHSQFKYSTVGRVSYLTTESQFNCKSKHLKTLNPVSHV